MVVLAGTACGGASRGSSSVTKEAFGTVDGRRVSLYTLRNARGMEARITNYGGIIVSLKVPDRDGRDGDVVLGFDSLQDYVRSSPYFGALVGRYANRIARGHFTLDGHTYTLAINDGPNSLHGGLKGFDKRVWSARSFEAQGGCGLTLRYTSPNGEEGYPGTLKVRVTYTLTDEDELVVDYRATTDRATPVNLTNHSYFNLAGAGSGDVLGQVVMINADSITPVDSTLIPTGEIRSVAGTPYDFRTPTPIGARIDEPDTQLRYGHGYDENFVLNRAARDTSLTLAARVYDPGSGRVLEIYTDQPGLQFYTGNYLDGTLKGKGGAVYGRHAGFAMETQHFPDSPNHPNFPSTILRPGQVYHTRTVYKFFARQASAD